MQKMQELDGRAITDELSAFDAVVETLSFTEARQAQ